MDLILIGAIIAIILVVIEMVMSRSASLTQAAIIVLAGAIVLDKLV